MVKSIVSPKTYLTYSLGCRTNQAEMENISLQLSACGLRQFKSSAPPFSPDLILLNTCVVTEKAERETRKEIRKLQRLYPKSFLAVLGCAVTAKQKFIINLPEADLLISNADKNRVIELLEQKYGSFQKRNQHPTIDNLYIHSGRKFIKIQEGCHLFCSFCQTAYLRDEPESVPPVQVIKEINFWLEKGIKEIILTGINIALYGFDLKEKINITDLVKLILKETPAERISFSSIYPEMLLPLTGLNPVNEFTKLVINNSRISQYFHLSLQSGSQSVLQRMNRKTDLSRLLDILKQIKVINPFFTFRADIITGFPEESEREFNETLDFIKNAKISFVHVFPFSARKGTKAYEMIKQKKWQDLPASVKQERVKKIMETAQTIRWQEAKKMINKTFKTLMVKPLKNRSFLGITDNGWQITVESQQLTTKHKGKIIPVKIKGFEENYLLGEGG